MTPKTPNNPNRMAGSVPYILKEGSVDLSVSGQYVCVYMCDKTGNYSYIYGSRNIFDNYLRGVQNSIQLYLLLQNPSLEHVGFKEKDVVEGLNGEKLENPIATLTKMLKDPIHLFGDTKDLNLTEETLTML